MTALPIIHPDPLVGGEVSRTNGGFQYGGPGEDTSEIRQTWPASYPHEDDVNQGIIFDSLIEEQAKVKNNTEGKSAIGQYQNGGGSDSRQVDMDATGWYVPNPTDYNPSNTPWDGTGMSPYQVDTNIVGPVTGASEKMNGNTLQPDYAPQGQYGVSTGGGTGAHETVTAYYQSQAAQVARDYSAAALFAST